jgi:hypothetical protein
VPFIWSILPVASCVQFSIKLNHLSLPLSARACACMCYTCKIMLRMCPMLDAVQTLSLQENCWLFTDDYQDCRWRRSIMKRSFWSIALDYCYEMFSAWQQLLYADMLDRRTRWWNYIVTDWGNSHLVTWLLRVRILTTKRNQFPCWLWQHLEKQKESLL